MAILIWVLVFNPQLGVLAESEATKNFQLALGNKSHSPVEHKTVVHSGIELLMMISEGYKVSDFGGGS